MASILTVCAAALLAFAVSHLLSRACSRQDYLPDHPNGRSSHGEVTPRSGGIAIMAGWVCGAVIVACFIDDISMTADLLKLSALGIFVLLIGFIDDRYSLSPLYKLAGQFAVAALFVWAFGGVTTAPLPIVGDFGLGPASVFVSIFWIVAFMNAYNFMDGAHGIAATAAIIVLAALAIATMKAGGGLVGVAGVLLAVSLIGFLRVNFPQGRLFMGDNGSQSVSLLIAGFALIAANKSDGAVSPLFVPTAMMPFLYDVAFTLGHRAGRRQNVLSAHNEHLYQLLIRQGVSHVRVTAFYASLTALSTAAAIMMLRAPASSQWMFPTLLAVLFVPASLALFLKCRREGYFTKTVVEDGEAAYANQNVRPLHQAAE
ncbi:MAG: hypothetical protein AAGJ73_03410 [Pseudomonadota bacterium]